MTEKECEHHHDEDEKMRKCIGAVVLGFIAVVLFVVFLVWAILHPHGPRFVLQDATIYAFNVSQPNYLTSNIQVTLSSRNPNDKIGIFYDRLDIYASYRNQQVTLATLLPATYQGHLDVTVWSPFLYGTTVPVAPYFSPALSQDLTAGMVLLNIKIDGWVRWKVGTWISGRYRLHVNCPAYITLAGHFSGDGPAVKYQLVQRCAVDV
ncbi:Late embryogenesis abundant protein LEA_2 subgroup [Arabidopsis thaliana x Arabidopsis arenosa]|uniref:Late embryogenesis abundant protein LEA_2 subgroup n=1 Tax=Arabidopsis thaliana x Arabidopsis arenosa TaxID=1240361 RepID=A0A8T1ZKD0_9BRAS|nr:Late embryogenesis abundant protein LEA_2 subgroup [Arabidopsis thaliana x Arabidopsis arenosa]